MSDEYKIKQLIPAEGTLSGFEACYWHDDRDKGIEFTTPVLAWAVVEITNDEGKSYVLTNLESLSMYGIGEDISEIGLDVETSNFAGIRKIQPVERFFMTAEELIAQGDKVGSLKKNIENLFDAVYNITHEFSDQEAIDALLASKCRGRELNKSIIDLIVKFKKGK